MKYGEGVITIFLGVTISVGICRATVDALRSVRENTIACATHSAKELQSTQGHLEFWTQPDARGDCRGCCSLMS